MSSLIRYETRNSALESDRTFVLGTDGLEIAYTSGIKRPSVYIPYADIQTIQLMTMHHQSQRIRICRIYARGIPRQELRDHRAVQLSLVEQKKDFQAFLTGLHQRVPETTRLTTGTWLFVALGALFVLLGAFGTVAFPIHPLGIWIPNPAGLLPLAAGGWTAYLNRPTAYARDAIPF